MAFAIGALHLFSTRPVFDTMKRVHGDSDVAVTLIRLLSQWPLAPDGFKVWSKRHEVSSCFYGLAGPLYGGLVWGECAQETVLRTTAWTLGAAGWLCLYVYACVFL